MKMSDLLTIIEKRLSATKDMEISISIEKDNININFVPVKIYNISCCIGTRAFKVMYNNLEDALVFWEETKENPLCKYVYLYEYESTDGVLEPSDLLYSYVKGEY